MAAYDAPIEVTIDPAPSLRSAARTDYAEAGFRRRIALLAVLLWLAYEWGIGNETVTPLLLVNVIGETDGATAILATTAVGFGFTLAQQLAAGFTALYGFSIFTRTGEAAWRRLQARFGSTPGEWSTLGLPARAALVFGLGTTAVALLQIAATGDVGVRRHRRAVVESSVLVSVLVGFFGGLVAAIAVLGRRVEPLAGPTEWAIRILGNPAFWLALLLVTAIVSRLRREPADEDGAAALDR